MINITTHYFDKVTSTNDLLKEAALQGFPCGTLYVAGSQEAGRGRMGRSFYSPQNTGLYMSLLLHRNQIPYDIRLLTAQTAVALAITLDRRFGVDTDIKWVNVIYLDGRKVAGILCECVFGSTGHCAIIGIGVNINTVLWPPEIQGRAGSLGTTLFTTEDKIHLAQQICDCILETVSNANSNWLDQYRSRSILTGQTVDVYPVADGSVAFSAQVKGIDQEANLVVVDSLGQEIHLFSGEVSVRPQSK